MSLWRSSRLTSAAVSLLVFIGLFWAGQQVEPTDAELAAVKDNGCSVIAGNGKVVTQPAAKCPVDIKLGNVLTTSGGAVSNMAPGDTASRPLDVTNVGNTKFDGLFLKAKPTAGPLAGSLRLRVRRCSVAWTPSPNGYTCRGTVVTILANGSASHTSLNLGNSPALTKNGVDRLLVDVTLLGSAADSLERSSTDVTYTFTASRN